MGADVGKRVLPVEPVKMVKLESTTTPLFGGGTESGSLSTVPEVPSTMGDMVGGAFGMFKLASTTTLCTGGGVGTVPSTFPTTALWVSSTGGPWIMVKVESTTTPLVDPGTVTEPPPSPTAPPPAAGAAMAGYVAGLLTPSMHVREGHAPMVERAAFTSQVPHASTFVLQFKHRLEQRCISKHVASLVAWLHTAAPK